MRSRSRESKRLGKTKTFGVEFEQNAISDSECKKIKTGDEVGKIKTPWPCFLYLNQKIKFSTNKHIFIKRYDVHTYMTYGCQIRNCWIFTKLRWSGIRIRSEKNYYNWKRTTPCEVKDAWYVTVEPKSWFYIILVV